ncbi:MAG TPA: M15 family metallopeptidase [Vicinamibacterales bacterium]|jgi:hypothetical protein
MPIIWNGLDSGLAPGIADLLTSVIDPLPYRYTVQQGYRSIAEQNALFAQGRNAQGQIVNKAAVVTDAAGGQSPHNFGLAIDVYPIVNNAIDYGFSGAAPEPTALALPAWTTLWNAIAANGDLVSGKDFALESGYDPGHVELRNWQAYTNQALPADITQVAGAASDSGDGGASAPTSAADGDLPADGPSAPPSLVTTVQNWLELDPGVTIGLAAIVGLVVMLGLKRRAQRAATKKAA